MFEVIKETGHENPKRGNKARNGGGRSFQHLEAANLNEPRKAAWYIYAVKGPRKVEQEEHGDPALILGGQQVIHNVCQRSCRPMDIVSLKISRQLITDYPLQDLGEARQDADGPELPH
ncbi:hypothetical protein ABMA27_007487 [Loxostege sticticalis]|uniref:Uncharacterized protein n=1 Tax=Loxostege sticticalis TaxID=481309 RepID=A0ABR3HFL9_LOXSC